MIAASLVGTVLSYLQIGVFVMAVYALVHAALQRSDAYLATGKLTKPVWVAILAAGTLVALVLDMFGMVIAVCAAGVYLVDVRPRLLEVQGKSR